VSLEVTRLERMCFPKVKIYRELVNTRKIESSHQKATLRQSPSQLHLEFYSVRQRKTAK